MLAAYYGCGENTQHLFDALKNLPFMADYIAEIYVNGNFAGRHDGFFAPFSFDVTDLTDTDRDNELVIVCRNDIPTLGIGDRLDGDKLYAATGPGWDDPETGWHHCPAGAGVFGRVTGNQNDDRCLSQTSGRHQPYRDSSAD